MAWNLIDLFVGRQSQLKTIREAIRAILSHIEISPREQNQLVTALSELLRNTIEYAKEGELALFAGKKSNRWEISFTLSDKGPGIQNLDQIIQGTHPFSRGKGLGIASAKRLLDSFELHSAADAGTEARGALSVYSLNENKLDGPDLELLRRNIMARFLNQEAYQYLQRMSDLTARQNVKLKEEILRNETKLSYISHDLKTPLNAIIGYAFLLGEELAPEEKKEAVERITANSQDLLQMIDTLLTDFQQSEKRIEIDLEPLIRGQIKNQLVPLLFGKEVEVVSRLEPGAKIFLSDPAPIHHILSNLFSNSAKFTERGTIQVITQRAPDNTRDGVKMIVSDSGAGIEPERLPKIFELFNHEPGYEGNGVGLSIVQDIVKQIGGTISVKSTRGVGTDFAIWLPVN